MEEYTIGYFTKVFPISEVAALNEAYFGKTEDVLKIEKAVGSIRKKFGTGDNVTNFNTWKSTIPNSIEERNLRNAIADAFGFSDVCIIWFQGLNASLATFSNSLAIDLGHKKLNNSMKKNSSRRNGIKYDKADGIAMMMILSTGVFTSDIFTDAEITAILIHEIGHNFTGALDDNVLYQFPALAEALSIIKTIVQATIDDDSEGLLTDIIVDIGVSAAMFSNYSHKSLAKSTDASKAMHRIQSKKDKDFGDNISAASFILIELMMSINHIKGLYNNLMWFKAPLMKILSKRILTKAFIKPFGYSDEKFADTFAQMYGYGPDLITGLQKLRTQYSSTVADSYISKIPLFSSLIELYTIPYKILMQLTDEHPYDPARYNMIVDSLRNELEDASMDESTRKLIERDIQNAERGISEFNKIKASDLVKRGGGTKVYQHVVNKLFGGDIRYKVGSIAKTNNDVMDKINSQLN